MKESGDSISDLFGANVFTHAVMRERLPKDVYKSLQQAMEGEQLLDPALAGVIANAMKDWAIEKGATHFCHWFQPMTGLTAEKHDSFISPTAGGGVVMEFSGKELYQGEPDASSFPSGGLRATFEARGYTAWDCTSPVFIKEDGENVTLFIPSAFCAYTGMALDKKTPLLRSLDAIHKQALRVLRALGNTQSRRVMATLGPEQEYFLVDRDVFEARMDLVLTGRTLFGAPSPRGQEMNDHYFGTIPERVGSFMHEVNTELWKLGVSAKTQHNEVAPSQYELAPIFTTANVGSDHNQLVMETLHKVARRHGFECLLHEKPFAGGNGSGKHVNWSLCTDDGINLLEPGKTPHENMVFLVVLGAVLKAVDQYAALLRASVATAGNEHRLGAHEAPPAIISVYLGEQLTDILGQLAQGSAKTSKKNGEIRLGVSTLPSLPKDSTDRNRTSPFAFTGNKFEFRMCGSSQSVSGPAFVLNTIVAEVFSEIADRLESSKDVQAEAQKILQKIAREHGRITFNGDNYAEEWVQEAKKRGLPNLRSTVEALSHILDEPNVKVLEKHGVLSREELRARTDILLETYSLAVNVEALTMVGMARRQIAPAVERYATSLGDAMEALSGAEVSSPTLRAKLRKVCDLMDALGEHTAGLEQATAEARSVKGTLKRAEAYRDGVIPAMHALRKAADSLETIVDTEVWPLPTYAQMLFA